MVLGVMENCGIILDIGWQSSKEIDWQGLAREG
jgi:hypothetical protein